VADSRALAQDAAELIEVDYDAEELAAVTAAALDPATPLVWPGSAATALSLTTLATRKEPTPPSPRRASVSRVDFTNNRLVCNYMEPRSAIGEWRDDENRFVLTTGSQGVHSMQYIVAGVLGVKKNQLRVITPDVGGGFGPKTFVYREHPLVLEAAKRLGRPVKWAGDRTEHFLTDAQGRDNAVKAEMAMDADGRFLALRVHLTANMGAYISQYGPLSLSSGSPCRPAFMTFRRSISTSRRFIPILVRSMPIVGQGALEAAFLIEKLADQCARDLGVPAHEIRRRNFIKPGQFPYNTATGRMYDVGEFEVISTPR
jgi:carbon-monoxide dehydrogenase large subunit